VNEAGKKVGSELLPSPRDDAPNKFAVKRAIDEVIVQVARSRQLIAEKAETCYRGLIDSRPKSHQVHRIGSSRSSRLSRAWSCSLNF
jgi:hypothetical protein